MKRRYVIEVIVDTDTDNTDIYSRVSWSVLVATPATGTPLAKGGTFDVRSACLRAAQVCVNDARTVGMLT